MRCLLYDTNENVREYRSIFIKDLFGFDKCFDFSFEFNQPLLLYPLCCLSLSAIVNSHGKTYGRTRHYYKSIRILIVLVVHFQYSVFFVVINGRENKIQCRTTIELTPMNFLNQH